MTEIWTMGEMVCEVMRPKVDMPLDKPDVFLGPFPSGAPAICIDAVARLGHGAGIVGGVGDDAFGRLLIKRLTDDGVNCSQVRIDKYGSTGVAFVTYFSDGSREFLFHLSETPAARPVTPTEPSFGDGVRFFHLMGCSLTASKYMGDEILKTMHLLLKKGGKISFDPNIRPELFKSPEAQTVVNEVLDNCSIILPGVPELHFITGKDGLEEGVDALFARPALEMVVVKNGSKGCLVCTRQEKIPVGIFPVEVKDPTGAGDSFDGAFLCGLLDGKSPVEAAKMASAAAALNTAAFGPMEGDISPEAVAAMMKNTPLSNG